MINAGLDAYVRGIKDKRKRLKPGQIRYVVFEGGGGKGFAYLGALRTLEDKKVLRFIEPDKADTPTADGQQHFRLDPRVTRGVGGASAGAITAFLISIGYTSRELDQFMRQKDRFLSFFDGGFYGKDAKGNAVSREVPIYGGSKPVTDDADEILAKTGVGMGESMYGLLFRVAAVSRMLKADPILNLVANTMDDLSSSIRDHAKAPPFDILMDHWKDFVINLERDWGFFAGASARKMFDQLLADRLPPGQNGKPQLNATFRKHFEHFGVELLVTGTNIMTGKSEIFSVIETPDFYVADAVRISMGIPFAFKPVVIDGQGPLNGVWVDGGLLNNLPFREFEDRPGDNPKTLALRLELENPPAKVEKFKDFLKLYGILLAVPGEAFITSSRSYQAIVLDTRGLDTLNFAPDDIAIANVYRAALKTTEAYFEPWNRDRPSATTLSD